VIAAAVLLRKAYFQAAVQHGHGADAATRRQDRGHFRNQFKLDSFPNLWGDAAHTQAVRQHLIIAQLRLSLTALCYNYLLLALPISNGRTYK
jgi:hypothetical protein